jgi:hypothetical protein
VVFLWDVDLGVGRGQALAILALTGRQSLWEVVVCEVLLDVEDPLWVIS